MVSTSKDGGYVISFAGIDISFKSININLMVVLELDDIKSEDHQSLRDSSSGDNECLYKISWQSIK